MGQIVNGKAKGYRTYTLKMQSGYDGSDHEWQRERTYCLKVQSGCDGSGHGRDSEVIKDVQSEDAERVQWVRP